MTNLKKTMLAGVAAFGALAAVSTVSVPDAEAGYHHRRPFVFITYTNNCRWVPGYTTCWWSHGKQYCKWVPGHRRCW